MKTEIYFQQRVFADQRLRKRGLFRPSLDTLVKFWKFSVSYTARHTKRHHDRLDELSDSDLRQLDPTWALGLIALRKDKLLVTLIEDLKEAHERLDQLSPQRMYRILLIRNIDKNFNIRMRMWMTCVVACIGVSAILWFSLSPWNPDWLAYQILYESKGGWLAAQSRDPLFILLIAGANVIFGLDGYDCFRNALSLYFILFTAAIALGKIFPLSKYRWLFISMPFVLMSLAFARFSIQVREGLATTLIILGIACIAHADSMRFCVKRKAIKLLALVLLACAASIHLGTIIFFVVAICVFWITVSTKTMRIRKHLVMIGLLILGFFQFILSLSDRLIAHAAIVFLDDRSIERPTLDSGQLILWGGYGLICYYLSVTVKNLIKTGQISGQLALFIRLISGPVTFITITSIYVLLLTLASTLQIVFYVRTLHLLLDVTLLVVATRSVRVLPIVLISVFFMIDQTRAVIKAVAIYYGISI